MKKIFLISLLALMCSVTAWAVDVTTWDELMAAVATPNASITMTAPINPPVGNATYDFKGATIANTTYVDPADSKTKKAYLTIDAGNAGNTITIKNATFVPIANDENGSVTIAAASANVTLENVSFSGTNCKGCIKLAQNYLVLNLDANCNLTASSRHSIVVQRSGITINNNGTLGSIIRSGNGSGLTINNAGTITKGLSISGLATGNGPLTVTVNNSGSWTQTENIDKAPKADKTGNYLCTYSLTNTGTCSFAGGTYDAIVRFEDASTNNVDLYVGTGTRFKEVPVGSKAIAHANCIFEKGVGNISIEDGYMWRESDGMIVELPHYVAEITHANSEVEYSTDLHEALTTAADGDIIKMIDDATLNYTARLNVNQSVAAKHLTLDINGHEFRAITSVIPTLELYGGSLNIINSVPGVGGIYNDATKDAIAINVYGTVLKNCNPKTAAIEDLYTYLNIAEGVNIYATNSGSSAIVVNHATEYRENDVVINKGTEIYVNYTATGTGEHCGVANGVRVDVHGSLYAQKYAFKVNGTVGYPDASVVSSKTGKTYGEYFESVKEHFYGEGTTETINVADTAYSPFIHIYPSAILDSDNDDSGAAGIYASGYARWIIEGTSKGTSGLYIRSGKVSLKGDAIIQSTYEGSATFEPGKKSGINTTGNAILVNPKSGYPGHIVFNVEGDAKISTGATGGAALFEYVQHAPFLESIAINGGQFTGPYALAISESTQASGNVVVFGTTLISEHVADVTGILAENVHTVVIPNSNNTTTVIVSQGAAPSNVTEWTDIAALEDGANANWTGTTAGVIGNGENTEKVVLGELQIISGTEANKQQLTIKKNSELRVDRLIANEYARIIIEDGAKLIVEGEQGINAPSTDNIEFVSSETENSVFLLNPAVTSNRHPSATYKFKSKARKISNGNYIWQRFGAPTYNGEVTMTWTADVRTAVYKCDYVAGQWQMLPDAGETKQYVLDEKPFHCYLMTIDKNPAEDVEYTFAGDLMGNADAPLNFVKGWNYYANSYTAPIDIKSFLNEIIDDFPGVSATVYAYKRNGDGTTNWVGVNLGSFTFGTPEVAKINPMQAFILQLRTGEAGEKGAINYAENVYNPFMGISPNPAPTRVREESNLNGAYITVTDGVQTEELKVLESADFSDEFDNGWDAEKFDNGNNFSLYCQESDLKLSTLATNNLTDKTIAFDNKNAGEFTLNVVSAVGTTVKIYDAIAKKLIELTEGTSYTFNAEAINDAARFIINPSDVPSAIDNTEIVGKASKFMKDGQLYIRRGDNVYTVQGQNVK